MVRYTTGRLLQLLKIPETYARWVLATTHGSWGARMAGCALLVESSPGTGTTHPPHPALLRPSPCNPTSIRRQVLRLLYGSGTGSLSCLSFARAYFVVPLYQYMRKRETHHYLFVASFNAQTTFISFLAKVNKAQSLLRKTFWGILRIWHFRNQHSTKKKRSGSRFFQQFARADGGLCSRIRRE